MCAEFNVSRVMKSTFARWFTETVLVQPSVTSYLEPLIRFVKPHFRAGAFTAKIIKITKQAGSIGLTLKPTGRFPEFVPGQHLDVSVEIAGRRLQRTFSICSSLQLLQQQGLIELAIRLVPDGQFSQWLQQSMRLGNWLQLSAPYGDFSLDQTKPMVLIAAGSGITPFRSMLLSISRLTKPLTLIYSYRKEPWFYDELQELTEKFPLFRFIAHDTAQQARLTAEQILKWVTPSHDADFYLCGPQPFSQALLQPLKLAGKKVRFESFGGFVQGGASNQITFHQHNSRRSVEGKGALLLLAEQAGLNPTYGCRRGICQQCQCQKISGQVRNLLTGELSGAGVEPIQLCISEAVTSLDIRL